MALTVNDGSLVLKGTSLGTTSSCCCADPPCVRDELFPCDLLLIHIDENRCEDDVFDLYIENPTTGKRRFIREIDLVSSPPGCCGFQSDGTQCPQTTIIVPVTIQKSDLDEQCRFAIRAVFKRANCCSTITRIRIEGPSGGGFGSYFGPGGYYQVFPADSFCDPPCDPPCLRSECEECSSGSCVYYCEESQVCCGGYCAPQCCDSSDCESGDTPEDEPVAGCCNGFCCSKECCIDAECTDATCSCDANLYGRSVVFEGKSFRLGEFLEYDEGNFVPGGSYWEGGVFGLYAFQRTDFNNDDCAPANVSRIRTVDLLCWDNEWFSLSASACRQNYDGCGPSQDSKVTYWITFYRCDCRGFPYEATTVELDDSYDPNPEIVGSPTCETPIPQFRFGG
jgi:hypothetical protein